MIFRFFVRVRKNYVILLVNYLMLYMRFSLTVFTLLVINITYGQTSGITGTLVDSAEHRSLENAVVVAIHEKDSLLLAHTRADANGRFELQAPDTSGIIVLVTHPYFADFSETLRPNRGSLNMGIINMLSKSKVLEEVIVKTGAPIRIKGDTTIYTADSFKVREGATLEELLRVLPGVQVDRNGEITALGEKVERFLVDGEEFFGSDPGIATKNLRADMVKDVQVYKGKSDQAAFTGIDDGQSKQTMNVVLKEDKKKGFFGKAEVGGGLKNKNLLSDQDKFSNALMFNAFKGKRKFSAYGIMSNTGYLNLDWNDRVRFGGGGDIVVGDAGSVTITMNNDNYNQSEGIPTNWNGGVHYNNKFNEDKHSINAGYRITKINAPSETKTYSRNFLPDSTWLSYTDNAAFSSNIKQGANLIYETKLDSMNTLKLTTQYNTNVTESDYRYYSENRTVDSALINQNDRVGSSKNDNKNFNTNLLWMHKFKKQYRTLSINANLNHITSNGDALLYSKLDFYENGSVDSSHIIDQQTLSHNVSNNFNTRLTYTEPLMQDFYLELSYGFTLNRNKNDRRIYANDGIGNYSQFIDSLSNNYEFNNVSNAPGISFRFNRKKVNLSFGTAAAFTNYMQKDLTNGTDRSYHFVNHSPRLNFIYKIKNSESIRFNYNGNSNAPSLNQLQPIPNNTDPLNIYVGNPLLKPSFNHRFSLSYSTYKTLKERGMWAAVNYNFTQNAFVQFSEFVQGIRRYYTVNTNGMANVSSYLNYDFKWKGPGIRLGVMGRYDFIRNVDYVANFNSNNGMAVKNITKRNVYSLSMNINKNLSQKFDIGLYPQVSYNNTKATVNTTANAKYWSGELNLWGNVQLPLNFEIRTDLNSIFIQKDPRFPTNNNYTIWNGYLTKRIYKNQFEARLSVYDILNQKRGYNRNFDSYSFRETYRMTLQRFWLISFVWNISKNNTSTRN